MERSAMVTHPSIFTSPGGTSHTVPPVSVLSPVTISSSVWLTTIVADIWYLAGRMPLVFQSIWRVMVWPGARLRNWAAMVVALVFVALMKSQKLSGKVRRSATVTLIMTAL